VKTFGQRVRHARLRYGWTQKELAHASGLAQSAIGNYESGQRYSSRALLSLATALNVNPRWLDSGQGPMESYDPGFSPAARPGKAHTEDAGAGGWPFPQIPSSHYQALSPRDKLLLERMVQAFIESCRAAGGDKAAPGSTKTAAGSRGGK